MTATELTRQFTGARVKPPNEIGWLTVVVFALSGPVVPALKVFSLADITVLVPDICGALVCIALCWKAFSSGRLSIPPALGGLLFVPFVRIASVGNTPDVVVHSLIAALRYVEWILIVVGTYNLCNGTQIAKIMRLYCLACAVQSVLSVAVFTKTAGLGALLTVGGYTGPILANFLLIAVVLALALALYSSGERSRRAWLAITALACVGILSTGVRTVYVLSGVSLIVLLLLGGKLISKVGASCCMIGATILVGLNLLSAYSGAFPALLWLKWRVETVPELYGMETGKERLELARQGIRMLQDHPVFGVGTGNYTQLLPSYLPGGIRGEFYTTHNYAVNVAAETGIIGLFAYLVHIWVVASLCRSSARRGLSSPDLQAYTVGVAAACLILIISDFVSWGSFTPSAAFLLGALMCLNRTCTHGGPRSGHGKVFLFLDTDRRVRRVLKRSGPPLRHNAG